MSMTWMSLKPESAKFLRISQPRPPAPLRMTCQRAVVAEVSVPLHYPISVCQHRTRTCRLEDTDKIFVSAMASTADMASCPVGKSGSVKGPGWSRMLLRYRLVWSVELLRRNINSEPYHRGSLAIFP